MDPSEKDTSKAGIPKMDPPAYVPLLSAPSAPYRSIQDLRSQIIANASILRPRSDPHKSSDDHVELVVAKAPSETLPQLRNTPSEKGLLQKQAQGVGSSFQSIGQAKHYALLIKRSNSKRDVPIIMRGPPRDTIEEALEWVLEQTEMQLHEQITKHGRMAGDGCTVM